jgi:prolyl-tRNA synthetase
MGSYGVGVSRLVAAIAEQHHDDKGLVWPASVAPAQVHIVVAARASQRGTSEERSAAVEAALRLGEELAAAGVEVIVDDRAGLSVGVRLTDAELIGAPWIVVVGRRLIEGFVELRRRAGGESQDVALSEVLPAVRSG